MLNIKTQEVLKMRKTLILLIISFFGLNINDAYSIESNPEVEHYVNTLTQQVTSLLNDKALSDQQKVSQVSNLLRENLDLTWMAKYTLGRHRKGLDGATFDKFKVAYSNYVIQAYSDLVKHYDGEQATIKSIHKLHDGEFIVKTELVKSNGQPPIKVDYFIRNMSKDSNMDLKVSDILTEGISMISSQQSEFNGIVINNDVDALIKELEKKHRSS